MKEDEGFFKRNESMIQASFAFANLCIAVAMLYSLLISRRQLEASVEPRLELTQGYPMDVYAPPIETNVISGITMTNVISVTRFDKSQMEAFRKSMTNSTRVIFKNTGAVDISDVQLIMRLKASQDENENVTNAVYENLSESISKSLCPDHNVIYDFKDDGYLNALVDPNRLRNEVVCYVIRYRRSVDMKPKYMLVCFEPFKFTPGSKESFPILLTRPAVGYYPGGGKPPGDCIEGLSRFLQRLNALPITGD
jgi:hypothetical protein